MEGRRGIGYGSVDLTKYAQGLIELDAEALRFAALMKVSNGQFGTGVKLDLHGPVLNTPAGQPPEYSVCN